MEGNPRLDRWGRPLQYLRVSVTDRCNFRCRYCMPEEIFGADYPFLRKEELLSFEELERLVRIFVSLGVTKVRLTGGEPLLRRDLPALVRKLAGMDGIEDLSLTTNGSLLEQQAADLKAAGLGRITVSLDSLNDERFGAMNGRGIPVRTVLAGIDAAERQRMRIKINMVVKKGFNDEDILPMARYFKERGHTLRFIEYMDVGNHNGWKLEHVVPSREIVRMIDREMPLEPVPGPYGEVARRYRYKGTGVEVGFISSVTEAFCASCTRARLSAEGELYTCLFAARGHDLKSLLRGGADDEELKAAISRVWAARTDRYSENRMNGTGNQGNKVEMYRIGG